MNEDEDVLTIAMEVGRQVFAYAKGDPARTLAYGAAAAVAIAGTAIGYGTYKYGGKMINWFCSD